VGALGWNAMQASAKNRRFLRFFVSRVLMR
jgi:hypothetical protein